MARFSVTLFALSAISALPSGAKDTFLQTMQKDQHKQAMAFAAENARLVHMRVYLKNGSKSPPLDSFHLIPGQPVIWRYEHEEAFFEKGEMIKHPLADLDSVVLDSGGTGFPAPNGRHMLFLQEAGAITYYGLRPKAEGMPFYLRKGDDPAARTSTRTIRDLVSDDPEAMEHIDRYADRWHWRLGFSAVGVGMIAAGLGIAAAMEEKDANGERKDSPPIAGILAMAGLVTAVVPVTPIVNFIWNPLPKRALDTYNRNRKTAAR